MNTGFHILAHISCVVFALKGNIGERYRPIGPLVYYTGLKISAGVYSSLYRSMFVPRPRAMVTVMNTTEGRGQERKDEKKKRKDQSYKDPIKKNIHSMVGAKISLGSLVTFDVCYRYFSDFLERGLLLTKKLLNQGFLMVRLKSSLRKFYGRHHDLVDRYVTDGTVLSGSSSAAVEGQPFTFTCTLDSPDITGGIVFKTAGDTVYTVTTDKDPCQGTGSGQAPASCTPTTCSCSADKKIISFTVSSVLKAWHQSQWRCNNLWGTAESSPIQLNVIVPFTNVEITPSGDITANINSAIQAVCTTTPASRPQASISWVLRTTVDTSINITGYSTEVTNPNNNDPDTAKTTTSTLNYTVTDKAYNGARIYCQATNNVTTTKTSQERRLIVQYPPEGSLTTSSNETGQLSEGMGVELLCQVSGGNPLATLAWSCKGQPVTGANTSSGNTARLKLDISLDRSYDGQSCVCTGSHPLWSRTASVDLSVQYPPVNTPGDLTRQPQKSYYLVNDLVTLNCRSPSTSKPLASIKWICKDQDVTSSAQDTSAGSVASSRLVVTMDKAYNGQTCVCTVSHPINSYKQSVSTTFVVHFTTTEQLVLQSTPLEKYQGDNVQIICSIRGGNPLSIVTLSCGSTNGIDNSNTDTSSRLVDLKNISKNRNNQTCVCTATHGDYAAFRLQKTLQLVIYYPPESPRITVDEEFPWLEGREGVLWCSATPGNPETIQYQWTGKIISAGSRNSQSISIRQLSYMDDKTEYRCQVSNKFTEDKAAVVSVSVTLDVQYKPRIKLQGSEATVRETESFTKTCTATGNPTPSVQWFKGISSESSLKENSVALSFTKILRDKAGLYTCTAVSQSGKYGQMEQNKTINIIVNYAPDVNISKSSNSIEGSTDFTLACHAQGIPSTYTFQAWQHHYEGIFIRRLSNTQEFRFSNLSYQDSGTYTCTVDNGIEDGNGILQQSSSLNISVMGPPHFTTELKPKVTGEDGEFLPILVEFITYPDKTFANWTRKDGDFSSTSIATHLHPVNTTFHGKNVVVTKYGYHSWMNFSNFSVLDKGSYSLSVSNPKGNIDYSFKADFSGPPDLPTSWTFESITPDSLVMNWTAGNNNGFHQTFHISYQSIGFHKVALPVNETQRKEKYGIQINDLNPETRYLFQFAVSNTKGYNPEKLLRNVTTMKVNLESSPTDQAAIIGGAAAGGSVFALIVIAVVGILIFKRRKAHAKGDATELMNRRNGNAEEDDPEDGMKPNIIYESAGPDYNRQSANANSSEKYVYSEVSRPTTSHGKSNDVYAEVKKTKKHEQEIGTALYAEVQKPAGKKGKGIKEEKPKDKKVGKKEKKSGPKLKPGDVYENVGAIGPEPKNTDGDVYANTVENENTPASRENTSRRKNKDGLIYIDVVIKNNQNGLGKGVIHGIENRNDYAEVDFTRHADPLPSDDEEDGETKKDPTTDEN